jgi:hypothetical protein
MWIDGSILWDMLGRGLEACGRLRGEEAGLDLFHATIFITSTIDLQLPSAKELRFLLFLTQQIHPRRLRHLNALNLPLHTRVSVAVNSDIDFLALRL